MKGPKEARLVESEQDDAAITRMEYECPHCGEQVQIDEDLDPAVVAVIVEPCEEGGGHRWKPVPRAGEKQKTGSSREQKRSG